MKRTAAALLACAGITHAQTMPPIALKGYEPGADAPTCPGKSAPLPGSLAGAIICKMDESTLAGEEVVAFNVTSWNGKILAVTVQLKDRGRSAGVGLVDALTQKFGRPQESKPHINRYAWQRGSFVLRFEGYEGYVTAADTSAVEELKKQNAGKNKADL